LLGRKTRSAKKRGRTTTRSRKKDLLEGKSRAAKRRTAPGLCQDAMAISGLDLRGKDSKARRNGPAEAK